MKDDAFKEKSLRDWWKLKYKIKREKDLLEILVYIIANVIICINILILYFGNRLLFYIEIKRHLIAIADLEIAICLNLLSFFIASFVIFLSVTDKSFLKLMLKTPDPNSDGISYLKTTILPFVEVIIICISTITFGMILKFITLSQATGPIAAILLKHLLWLSLIAAGSYFIAANLLVSLGLRLKDFIYNQLHIIMATVDLSK